MSAHMFSLVPHVYRPRSTFQRDHTLKTTFDSGYLIPIYCDEVLPGDTKKMTEYSMARMATPIFPVMDDLYFETFYFFVPNRLVWEHWENFMFQREDPLDDSEKTDYVIPSLHLKKGDSKVGDIYDHFGLPVCNKLFTGSIDVNSLPLRGYNRIYNDWFRDENLQSPLVHRRTDSGDLVEDFKLVKRGKRHDMFTSALPTPQLGEPIGFGFENATLPVYGSGTPIAVRPISGTGYGRLTMNSGKSVSVDTMGTSMGAGLIRFENKTEIGDGSSPFAADLSSLRITVEQLREACAVQSLMERLMSGGHRYVEMLYSVFGCTQPDGRMQRAEYLGGSSTPISVTPIAQTSQSSDKSPQGNMAAYATCSHGGHGFRRTFTEHGYIIGLCNVRARLSYSQGLQKMWSRRTPYDFWFPQWDNLGEEAVKEKEIVCTGEHVSDDQAFGFQERGYEYRYYPDMTTGLFRTDIDQSLDAWHFGQHFSSAPHLNAGFIEEDPPLKRCLAIPSEPDFLLDMKFVQTDSREMSLYSIPGIGKHF